MASHFKCCNNPEVSPCKCCNSSDGSTCSCFGCPKLCSCKHCSEVSACKCCNSPGGSRCSCLECAKLSSCKRCPEQSTCKSCSSSEGSTFNCFGCPKSSLCKCCPEEFTCNCCRFLTESQCTCCQRNKVQELEPVQSGWTSRSRLDKEVCGGRCQLRLFIVIFMIVILIFIILSVSISVPLALKSSGGTTTLLSRVLLDECNKTCEWSEWTECSVTCGNGSQVRYPNCTTTSGSCNSSMFETQVCTNLYPCPSGGTTTLRTTLPTTLPTTTLPTTTLPTTTLPTTTLPTTTLPTTTLPTTTLPTTTLPTTTLPTTTLPTTLSTTLPPDECNRTCEWLEWEACSKSCGNGTRKRYLNCTTNATACNHVFDTQDCNTFNCAEWSEWTECSTTCGNGSQVRYPNCTTTSGPCNSSMFETQVCTNFYPCPTEWSEWTECSTICGNGIQVRYPNCTTTSGPCNSSMFETQVCTNLYPCPSVHDICSTDMPAWKVEGLNSSAIKLVNCSASEMVNVEELLLFVSQSELSDYGKYEIVQVNSPSDESCVVSLVSPLSKLSNLASNPCEIIAQRLPTFDNMNLTWWTTLTCRARSGAIGGILALRATNLLIDNTSKIEVSGAGYRGGDPGAPDSAGGGGGGGGETFTCLPETEGKGGKSYSAGSGSGGAGQSFFATGGPGGYHAGGSGGSKEGNTGTGGGGGGGHFSGGGGGGSGDACGGPGGNGGFAIQEIGRFAGGGADEGCPGVDGRNNTLTPGGKDGTTSRGGTGGSTMNGNQYGSGGGGGGMQYGNLDFENRISFGGGGGGAGGMTYGGPSGWGGTGGAGGGIILLFVKQLILEGKIEANGEQGQCYPDRGIYKTGAGGSGAGGSIVIYADELYGEASTKLSVSGGPPNNNCTFGSGGGGGGGVGRWVIKTSSSVFKSGG